MAFCRYYVHTSRKPPVMHNGRTGSTHIMHPTDAVIAFHELGNTWIFCARIPIFMIWWSCISSVSWGRCAPMCFQRQVPTSHELDICTNPISYRDNAMFFGLHNLIFKKYFKFITQVSLCFPLENKAALNKSD